MITLVVINCLLVLNCFALVFVVLAQNPKDKGNMLLDNSGVMKQLVGVSAMPSFLEKATYFLLASLFCLTMIFSSLLVW